MKFYNRLIFKFVIFVVAFTLLPFMFVTIRGLRQLQDVEMSRIYEKNTILAQSYKSLIEERMRGLENAMDSLTQNIVQNIDDEAYVKLRLNYLVETSDLISQLFVIDPSGMQRYKTSGSLGDRSDRDYFIKALSGEKNYSSVIISRTTYSPIIVYAMPFYLDDELIGVIGGTIDLAFLNEMMVINQLDTESYAFIVDREGHPIVHPNKALIENNVSLMAIEPIRLAVEMKSGTSVYSYEGEEKLAAYLFIDKFDWGLVVQEPYDRRGIQIDYLTSNFLTYVLIIGAILLLGIIFFGRSIEKITGEFVAQVTKLQHSDFSVAFSVKTMQRKDELGLVARNQVETIQSLERLLIENNSAKEIAQKRYEHERQLSLELQNTHAKMNAIFHATEDAFFSYVIETGEFVYSEKVLSFLDEKEMMMTQQGLSFFVHMDESDSQLFQQTWDRIYKGEMTTDVIEQKYSKLEGEFFYRFTLLSYCDFTNQSHIIVSIKDITIEKEQEEKLYKRLIYHPLTGLLNRSGIIERLNELITQSTKQLAVILYDINDFRYINSTFGYKVGDEMLRGIAEVLKKHDGILLGLGHIGSDRFCAIYGDELRDTEWMRFFTDNFESIICGSTEMVIKGTLGVAIHEQDQDAATLLRNAEVALFEAKSNASMNYAFYKKSFDTELNERFTMIKHLEKAIDHNEIYMMYQPSVLTHSGDVVGYEALVRWDSNHYGLVSPTVFIELAEKTGYILELGKFILRESMLFAKEINRSGLFYTVSVNISPKQLIDTRFATMFIDMMEELDVGCQHICIEITETAYMENHEVVKEVLVMLKEKGIRIYLDDFGTGYSSLSYIRNLPIDVIKIDKAFIDEIHLDQKAYEMLDAIISIAKSFKMQVVAEGVEYEEQVEILCGLDCDYTQGYYFGKPQKASHYIQTKNIATNH